MVRVHFYNPRTQYGAQSIRQWWKMKLAKKSKQFPQSKQLGKIITLEKKTHLIKTVIMQAVRVNGHAKSEDDCNDRHYDLITLNIKCSRKCAIPLLLSFSWRCPASATMPTYKQCCVMYTGATPINNDVMSDHWTLTRTKTPRNTPSLAFKSLLQLIHSYW